MALNFALKKGQKYELTIKPQDAVNQPGDLVSGPTVASQAPGVLSVGPVTVQPDGSYKCVLTAVAKGVANIDVDAVGDGPLHEEVDGAVNNPLARKLILSGAVS